MNEEVEIGLIRLIATDRIEIPISSMSGKLKRQRPKIAKDVSGRFKVRYNGKRVYAGIEQEDKMKARTVKEGILAFSQDYPKMGAVLQGYIDEERLKKETHMTFGMYDGCRITADDYRDVMTNLGFTPTEAENLYPRLMEISRKISKKRPEEKSIMIG